MAVQRCLHTAADDGKRSSGAMDVAFRPGGINVMEGLPLRGLCKESEVSVQLPREVSVRET